MAREGALYVALGDAPKISFREFIKSIKSEEKDEFDAVVDG